MPENELFIKKNVIIINMMIQSIIINKLSKIFENNVSRETGL